MVCILPMLMQFSIVLLSSGMLKKKPFGMYSQNACLFYNSFVYDTEYNGLSHCLDEGKRLAEKLGDKRLLFMCNHGVLLAASTADRAFDDIYYLERACMYQVRRKQDKTFPLNFKPSEERMRSSGIRSNFWCAQILSRLGLRTEQTEQIAHPLSLAI